jgi:predicted nuclease with TOPRIM domain
MIDWTAYRAFLADVEKAESSGRRWHCECLCDDGSWGQAAVYECGPDACHYRVVYDDPLEPEVPLEGWCGVYTLNGSRVLSSAVFDTEEQAKRWCGKCETVRVREVVEATPNPLAEAAAEVLADPNPLSEEVERLAVAIGKERSEVEILRADRDRLKRMVDDPCNVWNSCCRLTDQLSEMTDNRDKLSEEVSRLQMELEAANAANVGAEQEVERLNSELAKRHSTICNLTEEVERLRDIHDNGPFECLYCGNRIEGDDHWRTCEKHPANAAIATLTEEVERLTEQLATFTRAADHVANAGRPTSYSANGWTMIGELYYADLTKAEREVERLKKFIADNKNGYEVAVEWRNKCQAAEREVERLSDEVTRLRVADGEMDAEIRRLRQQLHGGASQYATVVAERDSLTRRLAVYEEYVNACYTCSTDNYAQKHGCSRGYSMTARRCRELAGEVE